MCTWDNLLKVTMKGYCQSAAANEGNLRWSMHHYFWFCATTWSWKTRPAAHSWQKICMVVKVNSDKGHAWTLLLHGTEIQLIWSACHDKTPYSCKFWRELKLAKWPPTNKTEFKFGSWWLCIQILIFHHTFIFGSMHVHHREHMYTDILCIFPW